MRWVIQNNLGKNEDHLKITETCIKYGYNHIPVEVIPFSLELPNIDNKEPTVYYGATNFINNVYRSKRWIPGTFFDENNFTLTACMEHYKDHMISYPCEFTTISKFAASHQPNDKLFFIRPIKDLKEFNGDVMDFNKIVKWDKQLRYLPGCDNNPMLNPDTEIMVAEPVGIANEWRLFIVNGKVITGSHYRTYMDLDVYYSLPEEVVNFAEEMCKIWMPNKIFVMDIAESAKRYYIIECNCFNSSGFYKSDIEKIIVEVSKYAEKFYTNAIAH